MFKSYDVVDAAALFALTPMGTSDEELKAILIAATDIPADRIDACLDELKPSGMIDHLRGLAMLLKLATGEDATPEALKQTFQGAVWNDDGENTSTYKVKIVDDDGETTSEITVQNTY
jgi:hypothetical protein